MGSAQKTHYQVSRKRSVKIHNKMKQSQKLQRLAGPNQLFLIPTKSILRKPLLDALPFAKTWRGGLFLVGFHLSAAIAGIALGLMILWVIGYVILSFSSR